MNSLDNKSGGAPFANGSENQLMRSTFFTGAPGGEGGGPSAGGGTVSLGSILQALRRRWVLGVTAGVVAAILGVAAVILFFPARFTASGAVQLITNAPRPLIGAGGDGVDPTIFKGTMAARVKSPMVLMAALKDLDTTSYSVKLLETALKTDFLLGPETLRLTLSGEDPHEVTMIVNRVIDAFINESRQDEEKRWLKTMETLESIRAKAESDYRRKKNQLNQELRDRNILDDKDLDKQYQDALTEAMFFKKDLYQAYLEASQLQEKLKSLNQKERDLQRDDLVLVMPGLERYLDAELAKTPDGKLLLDRKVQLQREMEFRKSPSTAAMNALNNQIENLRAKIRPLIMAQWRADAQAQVSIDRNLLNAEINASNAKKEFVEKELRKVEQKAVLLNPLTRRLPPAIEALRDDVLRAESALLELNKTFAQLLLEPRPEGRVKEWSRAEVPSGRDYSRQIKFGAAGALGFFFVGLFGVGYLEFRSGRISVSDEVMQGLGMPVIGTLPPVSAKVRNLTETKESSAAQSRLMEAVDSVRSYLLHTARTDKVNVVMVTSAGVGEGKTSLASQLAASLARSWRKTLLIDGDLRHPATHTLFKLPLEPGFSEVLRGEATPEEAIKPTSLSRLWLMPAGHCDAHAVQALAQENVRTMFEDLKQQYEFIIVDSCPVLPVADSLSLGQHVDGVLYAVLRDVSRVPAIKAAQARLANLNIRTLGAVLIGTHADTGNPGARYAMLEGSVK